MMRINSLETEAAGAKRGLIVERLGCLEARERQIIERRLALHGYRHPKTHAAIAAELGISSSTVRKIEALAVAKLSRRLAA